MTGAGNGGGGLPTRLPHGMVDRGLSGTRVARGEDAATEAALLVSNGHSIIDRWVAWG